MRLFLFVLFSHVTSSLKQYMNVLYTVSSGVPDFPDSMIVIEISGVQTGYCDSKQKTAVPKQDWVNDLIKNDPLYWSWYTEECKVYHQYLYVEFQDLKKRLNRTGDIHTLQKLSRCEWDDETEEVSASHQCGFDGEDFLTFDLKTQTWIAAEPRSVMTKRLWDSEKYRNHFLENFLNHACILCVKKNLQYGRRSLLRTELPSVSLLQRTPSSPLRCHATGFYPDRAHLFWSRDGEELHEEVVRGEILPNHDGTFQMSVDLELSAVQAADWGRYDCVFQLNGTKEITKLDKAVIRTNFAPGFPILVCLTCVAVIAIVLIIFIIIFKDKIAEHLSCPSETSTEQRPSPREDDRGTQYRVRILRYNHDI